ncbi:MAG: hypothetical protein P8M72_07805 [Gammaproteobacteria bacterium]|nr:hypothetical protein [Gammaproteobacteria bacterium]
MTENELEKKLSQLNLANPSANYLEKGIEQINNESGESIWHRYMPLVLASALVASVAINVLQLVSSQQQLEMSDAGQLAQCDVSNASASAVDLPEFQMVTFESELTPLGMC